MAMTAMNTMPVQTQQMAGDPTQLSQPMPPQRPSADILLRKKKKKDEKKPLPPSQQHWSQKPSADILTRRSK